MTYEQKLDALVKSLAALTVATKNINSATTECVKATGALNSAQLQSHCAYDAYDAAKQVFDAATLAFVE